MKAYMRFARKTKKITVLLLTVLFLLGNLTLVGPASVFAESEENTEGTAPVASENPTQPEADTPPETGEVPGASQESEIPVDAQEGADPSETPVDPASAENPLRDLQPDNRGTITDVNTNTVESQDRNIMPMNIIDDPETIGTVEFHAKGTLFKMFFVKLTEESVGAIPDPGIPPGEEDEAFLGWFLSADGTGDPYDISAPDRADFGADKKLKLYAKFNKVISINFYNEDILIHKITFSDPQETPMLTQEILDEERNLVYEGQKVFVGWTDDPDYDPETVEVLTVPPGGRELDDSINLHAVYKPAYIISFESNGGTAYAPIAVQQGHKLSDDPEAYGSYTNTLNIAKAGWIFKGWYTDEALTSEFDPEAAIHENIKLYAKWTPGTADVLIVHWQEKVGLDIDHVLQRPSDYEIRESEVVRRTTDDNLILADENIAKTYTGFEAGDFNGITEVTVSGDGSTQINIYYDRSIYQFTAWHGSLNFWGYYNGNVIHTRDYKYGASLKPSWDVISGLYPRDHWYTTRTGNTSYSEPPNMPAEDLTVYGREEGNSDYIIFYAELKGTETIPIEGKDDFSFKGPGSGLVVTIEDYVDIPGFTRTGREVGRAFVWNGVQRRYEMTLTYKKNTYVLSFQNLEGADAPSGGSSQSILFAAGLDGLDDPYQVYENGTGTTNVVGSVTKAFKGWYRNKDYVGEPYTLEGKTMPAEDLILYAKWEELPHTVYVHESSDKNSAYETIEVAHNGTVTSDQVEEVQPLENIKPPEAEDSDFAGWYWYLNGKFMPFTFGTPITEDIHLYPVWLNQAYHVIYKPGEAGDAAAGLMPVDNTDYLINSTAQVLPLNGELANKVFKGWKIEKTGETREPGQTVDIKREKLNENSKEVWLIAQWEDIVFTKLTYKANGGVGEDYLVEDLDNNGKVTVLGNDVTGHTREGYRFAGWKKDPNGEAVEFRPGDEIAVDNINEDEANILYAHWIEQIDVTATKNWSDNTPDPKPEIWFKLYRKVDNGQREAVGSVKKVEGDEAVWTGLDAADENGNTYVYEVEEVNANGEPYVPNGFSKEENGTTVANTYSPEPTALSLSGTKVLKGRIFTTGEFEFSLTQANADGTPIADDVTISNVGNTIPINLTFNAPGTYHYLLKEIDNGLPGVTYDSTEYLITVTVTDTNGDLTAVLDGYQSRADATSNFETAEALEALVFKNKYEATASWQPKINKVLNGDDLAEGEFTFTLSKRGEQGQEELLQTKSNNADGTVPFDGIEFDQTDISKSYTYVVREVTGDSGSIIYDAKLITYTVSITYDAENKAMKVTSTPDTQTAQTFTNEYVESNKVGFTVTKEFGVIEPGENQFTFRLEQTSGPNMELNPPEQHQTQEVKNLAGGAVVFEPITYEASDVGTYTYSITEVVPDPRAQYIEYDEDPIVVTVTVSVDNDTNQVNTVVEYTRRAFKNLYKATGSWAPELKKTLNGEAPGVGPEEGRVFNFHIIKSGETAVLSTGTSDTDGNITFEPIQYTQDDIGKIYTYIVKELNDGENGMIYDRVHTIYEVEIKHDGEGNILPDAELISEHKDFANTYKAEGEWQPQVFQKVLNAGGRELKAGEFQFVLIQKDPEDPENEGVLVQTKGNTADGEIIFDPVSYDQNDIGKTYNYTIEEVKPETPEGDMTYSNLVVTATVKVTDAGRGKLAVDVTYDTADNTFTNTYKAEGEWQPKEFLKVLDAGGRKLEAGEFQFELKQTAPALPANEEVLQTKSNAADGKVIFDPVSYDQDDIGKTYVYTISEVFGNEANMTYSGLTFTATVKIKDAKNGALAVDVTYDTADNTFTNTYTAEGAFTPEVQKILEGRTLKSGEFKFTLTEETEEGADAPYTDSQSNAQNGQVVFRPINYTQEDIGKTFTYKIQETAGTETGMNYDDGTVTIVVKVSDQGNGILLIDTQYSANEFTNTYEASTDWDPSEIDSESGTKLKKVLKGRKLQAEEFSFTLTQTGLAEDEAGLANLPETVTNDADGNILFSAHTFTQDDIGETFTFEIKEDIPDQKEKRMTYDEKIIEVTLKIADAGNGKLRFITTYKEQETDQDKTEFKNVYTKPDTPPGDDDPDPDPDEPSIVIPDPPFGFVFVPEAKTDHAKAPGKAVTKIPATGETLDYTPGIIALALLALALLLKRKIR